MYQTDIIFMDGAVVPSPEEMTVIVETALRDRGYFTEHVASGWTDRRIIMALRHDEPVEQKMSEREAQMFAHNYPGMHLFFLEDA